MEFLNFLKWLKRYKTILIAVPIVTGIAAFLISIKLPEKYTSHARLSSAIADKSQQLVEDNQQQESAINEEFDNLLQTILMNKIIDRVSYKLMLHDLQNNYPFHKPSKTLDAYTPEQKKELADKLNTYYTEDKALNSTYGDEKNIDKIIKSAGYDNEALRKHLSVYHVDNSEYINLEYYSDNPQLSAFVLNTLSNEFINYYTTVFTANRTRSVKFLDSLVKDKQTALASQMDMLKKYKIDNGILNVDDQAKSTYDQIADMETKKTNAEKDMVAYSVALKNIDSKFSPNNRKYLESSVSALNSEIVNTKDQISALNNEYVKSGFDGKYKSKMDSLQKQLTTEIYSQTDNYAYNPSASKENLVAQKLNLEVSKDLAQNSVQSIDNELTKLNSNLQKLVPNLATIQAYQAKIEVANKEYLEVLQKYNQASLEANYNTPVRLVEKAVPGDAAPNKKILLVALSSVTSFILAVLVFFIMFYFDHSINSSEQLQDELDIKVIGSLNRINGEFLNLQDLWNGNVNDPNSRLFKNSLRSIRHSIENEVPDGSILAVTSLNEGEGKTFLTISLAYAFSTINKKVLIIDGNFSHPDISKTIKMPNYLEKYLVDGGAYQQLKESVNVIGNKGGDSSLLELTDTGNIHDFFTTLRAIYDVIIVETSALTGISEAAAKEWIGYADKTVVVFESGRALTPPMQANVKYLKNLGNNKVMGMVLNKYVSPYMTNNNHLHLSIRKPEKLPAVYGA